VTCKQTFLWVQFIRHKYPGEGLMEIQEHSGSYVLTSIAKAFEKLCDGFHLRLGDGGSSFWFEDLNIALEVSFVDVHDIGLRVCDVVNGDGNCDLSNVDSLLHGDLMLLGFVGISGMQIF